MTAGCGWAAEFRMAAFVDESSERVRGSDVRQRHLGDSHASRNAEGARRRDPDARFRELLKWILS